MFGRGRRFVGGFRRLWRSIRADSSERRRFLPGDELILAPAGTLTHGITIAAPPEAVWPWLAQMGAGNRAGWYSYDRLDNGGRKSANRVIPELQDVSVGTVFPALPGATEGFVALAVEDGRWLVLGWPDRDGQPVVTWAFFLRRDGDSTRVLVRARAAEGYRFRGLPRWVSVFVAALVHHVMERKQLLGLAARAECGARNYRGTLRAIAHDH